MASSRKTQPAQVKNDKLADKLVKVRCVRSRDIYWPRRAAKKGVVTLQHFTQT
jgi:hypothetical protein